MGGSKLRRNLNKLQCKRIAFSISVFRVTIVLCVIESGLFKVYSNRIFCLHLSRKQLNAYLRYKGKEASLCLLNVAGRRWPPRIA